MPFQEVIHFPLKPRLEALLRCESYRTALAYENWRPQCPDEDVVADACDCDAWKSTGDTRHECIPPIKLLFCFDGIPANNHAGSESLVPAELVILSLPPWLRYKEMNIQISMLLPDELSAAQQKKFFDKVIEVDYNPMYKEGITDAFTGDKIQVQMFGQTMDLKGREKLLSQISVQSYVGCSHCSAVFPKGCGGPCFGIARKSLPEGHPLRKQHCGPDYEYTSSEESGII